MYDGGQVARRQGKKVKKKKKSDMVHRMVDEYGITCRLRFKSA